MALSHGPPNACGVGPAHHTTTSWIPGTSPRGSMLLATKKNTSVWQNMISESNIPCNLSGPNAFFNFQLSREHCSLHTLVDMMWLLPGRSPEGLNSLGHWKLDLVWQIIISESNITCYLAGQRFFFPLNQTRDIAHISIIWHAGAHGVKHFGPMKTPFRMTKYDVWKLDHFLLVWPKVLKVYDNALFSQGFPHLAALYKPNCTTALCIKLNTVVC